MAEKRMAGRGHKRLVSIMSMAVLISACGGVHLDDSISTTTTNVEASADGGVIAIAASQAVASTLPPEPPCPPFVLTQLRDNRTGEILEALYRVCNGNDEILLTDESGSGSPVTP